MTEDPQKKEYKVKLDVFNGPMDLLLYLIKRDEIDIYDIPIARITEEYIEFVDLIKSINVEYAAEFLVLASQLLEIKSRMLLPDTDPLGEDDVHIEDPRTNLIQELMEYRKFRQRADNLRQRAQEAGRYVPRQVHRFVGADGVELELEEIGVWELSEAFRTVLKATMQYSPQVIVYDDTPMETIMEDIQWKVAEKGHLKFFDLIGTPRDRGRLISYFLGLLELTKLKEIRLMQRHDGDDIYITIRTDHTASRITPAKDNTQEPSAKPAENRPEGI